jgi:hypothetical protein
VQKGLVDETPWFNDQTRCEYDTPVAAYARDHALAVPTPQRFFHKLFGFGSATGTSADDFPNIGRIARVKFDLPYKGQSIEGAFSREVLERVEAAA